MPPQPVSIAILGAGAAGLCMAIALKRAAIESFTVYEKADRVGGTWRDNTYPGAGCDVPSHLYSFSFEPKADWSHVFSEQREIEAYFEHCADKYALRPHVRFHTEIVGARFDEARGAWTLEASDGRVFEANVLVAGCGQLNRPKVPAIPGLASFAGTSFHSARWNHAHDLRGRNVAVIGTGASAAQFIPRIAPLAGKLSVFQRSANWVFPRGDRAYRDVERWVFARLPAIERLHRRGIYLSLEARFYSLVQDSFMSRFTEWMARRHLNAQIANPALRAALTPDYPVGCKRIVISDDYYPTLERPNVALVTSPIDRVTEDALVTQDGARHPADTIIFGTGFESTSFLAPIAITGRDGARLADAWRGGAEAHLGMTVPGFPNLFLLYGPNTNLGHNSILFMIECQVRYTLACVRRLAEKQLSWIDVRRDAARRSNERLQRAIAKTAWAAGCTSWYKDETGKVTNNWSGPTLEYWWRTRRPEWSEFSPHTLPSARYNDQTC
ncbi:MAG: flavin-containing monooxygenase [Polyangiaceae bacterium]